MPLLAELSQILAESLAKFSDREVLPHSFDHPKHFVNAGDSFRIVIGVGAQDEEAVVAFFLGDLFVVDSKVAATLDLQEPAIAFISHQTLVATAQLFAQGLENGGAVVSILSSLLLVVSAAI